MFATRSSELLTREEPGFPAAAAAGGASIKTGTSPDRAAAGTGNILFLLSVSAVVVAMAALVSDDTTNRAGCHEQPATGLSR